MSWWDDLFTSKKTTLQPDKPESAMAAGGALSSWAQKYLQKYEPGKAYEGKLTAPMGAAETKGQDWLMQFLDQKGPGDMYGLAADELKKTMTGGYDPHTSKYYQAMRTGAGYEMEDAVDQLRRSQGARGAYFTESARGEEADMRRKGSNYLMQLLGELSEGERGRKWEGVGKAMELEKYETGLPLEKAKAGATTGAIPRMIEQSDLESKYQDFVRQQKELGGVVGAAQGVYGTSVGYGVKEYETPSPFERIMESVGGFAGNLAGSGAFNNLFPWNKPATG